MNEIAYKCGFNNISNFNRIFKKKKDCTPKEFRLAYTSSGTRTFI
ncbi:AraC family transcriptional regulator [Chitinophaga niastensis]